MPQSDGTISLLASGRGRLAVLEAGAWFRGLLIRGRGWSAVIMFATGRGVASFRGMTLTTRLCIATFRGVTGMTRRRVVRLIAPIIVKVRRRTRMGGRGRGLVTSGVSLGRVSPRVFRSRWGHRAVVFRLVARVASVFQVRAGGAYVAGGTSMGRRGGTSKGAARATCAIVRRCSAGAGLCATSWHIGARSPVSSFWSPGSTARLAGAGRLSSH